MNGKKKISSIGREINRALLKNHKLTMELIESFLPMDSKEKAEELRKRLKE